MSEFKVYSYSRDRHVVSIDRTKAHKAPALVNYYNLLIARAYFRRMAHVRFHHDKIAITDFIDFLIPGSRYRVSRKASLTAYLMLQKGSLHTHTFGRSKHPIYVAQVHKLVNFLDDEIKKCIFRELHSVDTKTFANPLSMHSALLALKDTMREELYTLVEIKETLRCFDEMADDFIQPTEELAEPCIYEFKMLMYETLRDFVRRTKPIPVQIKEFNYLCKELFRIMQVSMDTFCNEICRDLMRELLMIGSDPEFELDWFTNVNNSGAIKLSL